MEVVDVRDCGAWYEGLSIGRDTVITRATSTHIVSQSTYAYLSFSAESGVHPHRTSCGDRHYCHFGWDAFAGFVEGESESHFDIVPEQR